MRYYKIMVLVLLLAILGFQMYFFLEYKRIDNSLGGFFQTPKDVGPAFKEFR